MPVTVVHDATHANISHLPAGLAAGYTTGSSDIQWTAADWHGHPGAVRICQDPTASDHTADALDVEAGAATLAAAARWYPAARAAYTAAARPGQRHPAIYASASMVTPLVNALVHAGIKSGPGLWVANWSETPAEAQAEVLAAAGPFPVIGIQHASGAFYDSSVFSASWLGDVATSGPHKHVTKAGDTIDSLSDSRGMKPESWLTLQRKLGTNVGALAAGPLKAGLEWRSIGP